MNPLRIITARARGGCYGCGRPFARAEWPVLDRLDRRWHMVCFLRDDSGRARVDPGVAPADRFLLPTMRGAPKIERPA